MCYSGAEYLRAAIEEASDVVGSDLILRPWKSVLGRIYVVMDACGPRKSSKGLLLFFYIQCQVFIENLHCFQKNDYWGVFQNEFDCTEHFTGSSMSRSQTGLEPLFLWKGSQFSHSENVIQVWAFRSKCKCGFIVLAMNWKQRGYEIRTLTGANKIARYCRLTVGVCVY